MIREISHEKSGLSQGVFWSRKRDDLDEDRDKRYIIHQVLMYGNLDDVRQLKRKYSLPVLEEVFLDHPMKVYTPQAFSFAYRVFFRLNEPVDARRYLKTSPRHS
jgi:hypothetical protein